MLGMTLYPLVLNIFHFFFAFYDSVGSVGGLGSGVSVPTVVESQYDIFAFVVFIPIGVESKGDRLIRKIGAQIPYFLSKFETPFYSYSHSLTSPHSILQILLHQKHE